MAVTLSLGKMSQNRFRDLYTVSSHWSAYWMPEEISPPYFVFNPSKSGSSTYLQYLILHEKMNKDVCGWVDL